MKKIYRIKFLRKILLPLLKYFGIDIKISHPWVEGGVVFLHSFKHKGYWYHGKNREIDTIAFLCRLWNFQLHDLSNP